MLAIGCLLVALVNLLELLDRKLTAYLA